MEPDVFAINLHQGIAILTSNEVVPLYVVYEEGERLVTAGPDSEGRWYAIDTAEFEAQGVH